MTKRLLALSLTAAFGVLAIVIGAAAGDFKPNVDIGGPTAIGPNSIGQLIKRYYELATAMVGTVAVVVMMFGGLKWMLAGGNPSKVSEAQTYIVSALTGVVLTISAYTMLKFINPDLVDFKAISPASPKQSQVYEKKQDVGQACTVGACISGQACVNNACKNDCEGKTNGTKCVADNFPNGGYCWGTYPICMICKTLGESCNNFYGNQCCQGTCKTSWFSFEGDKCKL